MTQDTKAEKLKITLKGKFPKIWTDWYLKRKIQGEGVNITEVKQISEDKTELVMTGEKKKLWKVVKHSKAPFLFIRMEQVIFQFLA